jgi:hypothetical protein
MKSEREGSRREKFSLYREGEQEEKLFPKNGVKREGSRGESFPPLQRRRAGGKIVPCIRMKSKEKVAEGKGFPFAEKDTRRKNCSQRMESKEKVAEGKDFFFAEKESRRKNWSPRMELKE